MTKSRRLTKWAAAMAMALVATVVVAQQRTAPAGEPAGRIAAVVPEASVIRVGTRPARTDVAAKDTPVWWNDVVRTVGRGRARIQLDDQSVLTLGSNSTLRVVKHEAKSQQTALELGYGRIRCQVSKLLAARSSFELRTPTAVAGVVGTDFGADSSVAGETRFLCMEGTVRVRNADPRVAGEVDCGAGMTTVVRTGLPPTPPVPADPAQLERWKHINEPADPAFADSIPPVAEDAMRQPAFPWVSDASAFPTLRFGRVEISGSVRFRAEGWAWFETDAAEDSYALAHSTIRLGLGQRFERAEWRVEIAQPSLFGLPERAVGPGPQGQLGLGATYYLANGNSTTAASVFPSQAFVRWHAPDKRFTLGRFQFVDGLERIPSDRTLAWLKRMRIAHRLLGDFGWSAVGRSNDGAVFALDTQRTNFTLAAARPTRGVFQANGLGSLDAGWIYGAFTVATAAERAELRIFGLGFEDARLVTKTDNRPLALRSGADRFENLRIGTVGAHYIHAMPTTAGAVDLLLWGVAQFGDWGTQRHRASAAAVELGWQPQLPKLKPWLRAGFHVSSGDNDPTDDRHGTFYPVLPTPRVYARYPFYNTQNNSDLSLMLILRPSPKFTLRSEAHAVWLTSRRDLWYSGGGAYNRTAFGYQGRPSNGNRHLANVWDLSAEYRFTPHWNLNFYYARAWGRGVVKSIYPRGPGSNFGYAELVYQF